MRPPRRHAAAGPQASASPRPSKKRCPLSKGPPKGARLRALSLFSGIGGFELAFTGVAEPVAYVDLDGDAQTVLRGRMKEKLIPPAPIFGDVRTLSARDLPVGGVEFIYGGWPCQDISTIGSRHGLAAGLRSGLIAHVWRLCDELGPRCLFLVRSHAAQSVSVHACFWCEGQRWPQQRVCPCMLVFVGVISV